jgi:hypothetical protein
MVIIERWNLDNNKKIRIEPMTSALLAKRSNQLM